jgi:hypothetical protein
MALATARRSAGRRRFAIGLAAMAALLAGCSSSGSSASTTTNAPSPPDRPVNLSLEQVGVTVRITWSAPSGGGHIRYRLSRGGNLMDSPTSTSFVDDTIEPGHRYVYSVVAERGGLRSPSATLTIKTHKPPLSTARLAGLFTVSATPLHTSGLSGVHNTTYGWTFSPLCKAGRCNSRWSAEGSHAVAARSGASYSFSFTAPMNVQCAGHRTTSTATVHFRVTAAEAENSKWKADKFNGTLAIETPAQLGCVSASEVDRIYGVFEG